jgi:hypothetical protein
VSINLPLIIFCGVQGGLAGCAAHVALLSLYRMRPKAGSALAAWLQKAKLPLRRAKP